MAEVSKSQVEKALEAVIYPGSGKSIIALGMVSEIFIADAKAYFSITVPADKAAEMEPLRLSAEQAAKGVEGIVGAVVALTADRKPGQQQPAPARPAAAPGRPATQPGSSKVGVPGVRAIIAVASGKGGVGKSTTAVNLALGLQSLGLKVGMLDADIYGPSLPRLLKISGRPQQQEDRIILPMENYGLKVMSMGFLVDEEAAMIWRGPMVQSALMQMLREVAWGELDVLVLDMPPGTGDAQLTIAQQVPLAGAVIVSTPQDLALIDARKGITMFRKVEVPLLGVIENMSYFIAPDTGARYDIFGHGGAKAEAERIGVPFLGEVPLTISIREMSDAGTPVVAAEPDGPQAAIYRDIAQKVWARIGASEQKAAPRIVFE
ncbi:Mrp/NBP35 family ATP-binding protein [Agrobacterium radiobacter]|jgi:ATP-binding protein involved in chromosome partitioning|uniref:Iron-sulfur cluster carrier protein n=2 Tax=Agrobacterium tumefaciens TaxID=358 RepID=A0AAW8LSX4_AGRTU|nr:MULTISPECIES: Mrp/NBP35 family ATP-binding protein [Agrobacterium]AYM04587.1 ATP-binding protein involved in chromosome partitioning [Agrobacterium tumefaciens]KWT89095.1 sodium:proton antiporter [Agrobacterium tumefaciens str. B6]MBP2564040.1 ATP-binding protein involved in chromosome partitioning [Agrobacterium tumefaciens]MCW8056622.1 Mrp/NBP35 family ATP-binding protein [Agrobacterium tumefaciens]MCW8144249.1 Mrp/NBP35 family ATP-binding protein [Agrobacterium tumefaciens]